MMRRPAPEVKPTTTVCEMKLTSAPRRAMPMPSCMSPDDERERQHERHVVVRAGRGERRHGREDDERHRIRRPGDLLPARPPQRGDDRQAASRSRGRTAGGMPASVAYATPCGSTTSALMRPAMKSARIVSRVTRWRHARKGKSLSASGDGETAGRGFAITVRGRAVSRTGTRPCLSTARPRARRSASGGRTGRRRRR
jgi:hypothetical protein